MELFGKSDIAILCIYQFVICLFIQQCTYENWPKSLRCSMCGHTKEVLVSNHHHQIASNAATLDENTHHNANNQTMASPDREFDDNCASNYIIPNKQAAPPPQQQPRNNANHRYQSCGGMAIGDSTPSNNCDTIPERRVRQMRRQADWQWLHACIGKLTSIIIGRN